MIEVDRLTKRFGPVTAVNDLSFAVRPGHVTGFLGPNGAGKTTTLKLILGLATPTAVAVIVVPGVLALLPSPWNGRLGRFALLDAARQATALRPAADLFSPGWSLLVLLAWPAAALAVAAVLITRRDV